MQTCAPTAEQHRQALPAFAPRQGGEAGFTLVEMLVALVLLSLVGLTLARFQTFQLSGTASLASAAAARLEADNQAVEVLAAPAAPAAVESGTSLNAGRMLHWTRTPGPSPDPALMPDLVSVDITVSLSPDTAPVASRSVLRTRGNPLPVVGQ